MRQIIVRYGLAIASVALAVVVRLAVPAFRELEGAFVFLFPAVMVSAALGGTGPGLLAVGLSVLAGAWFFMEPRSSLQDLPAHQLLRAALFILEGVFISVLSGILHRARARAVLSQRAVEHESERRQQLEREILDISNQERQRIGSDLHDGLGQHLTGVAFMSKALASRLETTASPQAPDARRIADLTSQAIGWTRELARGLSPVGLPMSDLGAALEQLAAGSREMFNVECALDYRLDAERIDDNSAMQLYRIAQEAITNAVRHGRARRILISLEPDLTGATLLIRDNGSGIPAQRSSSNGLGLAIMEYRARMLGGQLQIGPDPEGGTRVTCSVPAAGLRKQDSPRP